MFVVLDVRWASGAHSYARFAAGTWRVLVSLIGEAGPQATSGAGSGTTHVRPRGWRCRGRLDGESARG